MEKVGTPPKSNLETEFDCAQDRIEFDCAQDRIEFDCAQDRRDFDCAQDRIELFLSLIINDL